ncbi:MAG: class I SAM-dependent methyltransferase [Deltaproteobacteria bacterium]|nr:MAG: class I SAM-dependent methyltransferase [Deltaproteobacteria bacterium]RTZ99547.1 MAG: class I SAM-dependent methyltransferase [Deltaproteobacteria bacterium]
MGYVFDFKDAKNYHLWAQNPRARLVVDLESSLMLDMLRPHPGETVLDIGCGTGVNLDRLIKHGIDVTGIDPSVYMLDFAEQHLGHRADLHHNYAETLPFEDNSFNHAIFMTSLEFVDDPHRAIAEACRVAKDKLFIGMLNRYALKNIYRRIQGIFRNTIYNRARFFSIWELKQMIHQLLGDVPVKWLTTCQFPTVSEGWKLRLEQSSWVQHSPFGAFAGMVVTLQPHFKTRPLPLKIQPKPAPKTVAGLEI